MSEKIRKEVAKITCGEFSVRVHSSEVKFQDYNDEVDDSRRYYSKENEYSLFFVSLNNDIRSKQSLRIQASFLSIQDK